MVVGAHGGARLSCLGFLGCSKVQESSSGRHSVGEASKQVRRVVVSAAGHGVVSHAEVGLLREMAEYTGLVEGVTDALIGTCKGVPTHAPGRVFTDLAVAVADGADAISGIGVLTDREELFGPVASMPTTWRVLDRVGPEQLPTVRAARAKARAAAWAAGAGPDLGEELRLLLTHRPPCPPPSRVPSPGYAFPQPLTRVTIVI